MDNFNDVVNSEKYIEFRKSSQSFNNVCESLMDSEPNTEVFLSIISQLCIVIDEAKDRL